MLHFCDPKGSVLSYNCCEILPSQPGAARSSWLGCCQGAAGAQCLTAAWPLPPLSTKQRLECHSPRNRSKISSRKWPGIVSWGSYEPRCFIKPLSCWKAAAQMPPGQLSSNAYFCLKPPMREPQETTRSTWCTTISLYKEPSASYSAKVMGLDSREEKWKSQLLSTMKKPTVLLEDQPSMNPFCRPSALLLQCHPMPKNTHSSHWLDLTAAILGSWRKLRATNHPNHIFYLREALCSSSFFAIPGFQGSFCLHSHRLCTSHSPSGAGMICNGFKTCLPQPVYSWSSSTTVHHSYRFW